MIQQLATPPAETTDSAALCHEAAGPSRCTTRPHMPLKSRGTAATRPLSLRTSFWWTLSGNIAYAACQAAMLIAVARMGSPEMVGQFALGLAICAPILVLFSLQLRTLLARDQAGTYQLKHYLSLRAITVCFSLMLMLAIVSLARYSAETSAIILIIGVARSVESLSDILYGFMQHRERLDLVSRSLLLRGGLSLVLLCLGLLFGGSLLYGVLGMAAGSLVVFLMFDRHAVARLKNATQQVVASEKSKPITNVRRIFSHDLWTLTWQAFPLGIVTALLAFNANVPRYFVESVMGIHGLGIFASISAVTVAMTTVVTALSQTATVRFAKYHSLGNRQAFRALLAKALALITGLGLAGILGAWLAGEPLLRVMFGREYAAHVDLLVWLMLAAALWNIAIVLGCAATASGRVRSQIWAMLLILGSNLGGCWVLVGPLSIQGAAIAAVVASTVGIVSYAGVLATEGELT